MRYNYRIACGLVVGLALMTQNADAQWYYPRGYGGYGWGGWGADPASGYMAGLGAYARGQGVYEVENAQAQAINLDTMLKWNKALRARQRALRAEQQQEDAEKTVERNERVKRAQLLDGTTLNNLLFQIYDADPGAVKSARAKSPISPSALREIPFEWDTEAITICIDQMTGKDSLPSTLMNPAYADERNALDKAVEEAIKEDSKGNVSAKTMKRVSEAIDNFRAKFRKNTPDFDPGYLDSDAYFNTLASLTRMLNDPSMKKILTALDNDRERTIGDLISFMQAYNLRFGAATSDRQVQIYERLAPTLARAANEVAGGDVPPPPAPDTTGQGLQEAAKEAFKKMKAEELKAHTREP
jgi:hypothetical protein